MDHLDDLGRVHGNDRVRDHLLARLAELGLEVATRPGEGFRASPKDPRSLSVGAVQNLIGVLPGIGPLGAIAMVGVSTLTIPVGVSTGSVNVSAFALAVGVSSFGIAVGVSSNADKTNYTLDSTYGAAGRISTAIWYVRGTAVGSGTGTSSDPWGP